MTKCVQPECGQKVVECHLGRLRGSKRSRICANTITSQAGGGYSDWKQRARKPANRGQCAVSRLAPIPGRIRLLLFRSARWLYIRLGNPTESDGGIPGIKKSQCTLTPDIKHLDL